jgi:aminoglycoside phosphotransferase (APT) family kinase protein
MNDRDRASASRIVGLARHDPERLGLPGTARDVSVRLLGQGESYAAWLVEAGGAAPVVVRIARRSLEDLPRPMADEFAALGQVPRDIGPSPILLDQSGASPLAAPYMVTSFVPGRVRPPEQWSEALLSAHAAQLAQLHERSFDRCGAITQPPERRSPTLSLIERFSSSLAWWQASHPAVVRDADVARLLPRVEAFVVAARPAFERLHRFALVHGDLIAPNILVDEAGVPRYVDWEWAEIGDPVQDFALLGGHVASSPDYLPLERGRIRSLLEAYLRRAGEREDTVDSLEIRHGAWEVLDRFFCSLHFRTRRGSADDRTGRYTNAVAELTAGLDRRLP